MDESEKRRERLKAMRMEASQAEVCTTVDTSPPPVSLANPLVDTYSNQPVQDNLLSTPRFDFYTDPMAAFSGNRRNNTSNRLPGGYYPTPNFTGSHFAQIPSPGNPGRPQFQTSYSPNQMMHHTPNPIYGSEYDRSPLPMTGPSPSSYNQSSNVSTGGNLPRPGFEQRNSPISPHQGRSQWLNQSGPNPMRGRGQSFSNNLRPSSGRGGGRGRGRGSHDYVSAQDFPHLFYCKSMLEDPWKFLEPVLPTVRDLKSWESLLPKSITSKKPRVTEISAGQANSQFSLAEYLASSYSEAVTDSENAS